VIVLTTSFLCLCLLYCYSTTVAAPEQTELQLEPAPALAVDWDTHLATDDYDDSFADLLQQPLDISNSSAPTITKTLLDEIECKASSAKRARTDDSAF
jgi:hypothetical protein